MKSFPWLLLLLLAGGPVAAAGECRAQLAPLLLATEPDRARLAEVRALCAAEAAAGDADAGYQSALFLLGLDGAWAPEEATAMIAAAALDGVAEAQYWLAWQRESGPLLADDPAEALYWYRLAAESDHVLALERLAQAHAQGELGLPRNAQLAAHYRARAAACAD